MVAALLYSSREYAAKRRVSHVLPNKTAGTIAAGPAPNRGALTAGGTPLVSLATLATPPARIWVSLTRIYELLSALYTTAVANAVHRFRSRCASDNRRCQAAWAIPS